MAQEQGKVMITKYVIYRTKQWFELVRQGWKTQVVIKHPILSDELLDGNGLEVAVMVRVK
jgi:hypothetical protein